MDERPEPAPEPDQLPDPIPAEPPTDLPPGPIESAAPAPELAASAVPRRRMDPLALGMLAGIFVLLLICVALAVVAWRHAPVNPAVPAAVWLLF